MGYALSWVAVKGGAADAVQAILCLRPAGPQEEIPESVIVAGALPNGWYLVLQNQSTIVDDVLARLSGLVEVVYCFVEDHVVFSAASAWDGGRLSWSVVHDAEKGRHHIEAQRLLSAALASIRDRLKAAQDADAGEKSGGDFIYDAPIEMARELTGFRHDQDIPGIAGDAFHILQRAKTTKRWGLF
jgi:hypothetical protein